MISIHMLPAGRGDCFLLVMQDMNNTQLLVIDSGLAGTIKFLKPRLNDLMTKYDFDIHMLLTHIDRDHIGGYKALFTDNNFKDYNRIAGFYYNTTESLKKLVPGLTPTMLEDDDRIFLETETSLKDAVTLEKLLRDKKVSVFTELITGYPITFCSGMQAVVLSPSATTLVNYKAWIEVQTVPVESGLPTATDITDYNKPLGTLMTNPFNPTTTITNASSISVLIEACGRRLLFLGDSCPADIVAALRNQGYSESLPLEVDVVKVSHHGSKHNTNSEMLRLIRGKYFLISGSGGEGHPDKEALARIVQTQKEPVFFFNYNIADDIFKPSEVEEFHIQTKFGEELTLT